MNSRGRWVNSAGEGRQGQSKLMDLAGRGKFGRVAERSLTEREDVIGVV